MKKRILGFIGGYLAGCVVCEYLIERDRRARERARYEFRRRYGALNPTAN